MSPVRLIPLGLSIALLALPLNAAPTKAGAKKAVTAKAAPKTASTPKPSTPALTRAAVDPAIAKAIADPRRKPANVARDKYRHPGQTLTFLGLKPEMTVVELDPGGGWYSEILAPFLADQGHYIAALEPGEGAQAFHTLVEADPDRFGKAVLTSFVPGQPSDIAPAGTADMVLAFRLIHNLLGSPEQPGDGNAPQAFADWYRALKPGGILGIEQHRLPEAMDSALEKTSGYVKRSTVIRLALAAGFQLAGASEVNRNAKDTHDWPKGVWTLPPTYRLGDTDKAKYAAIGESDRMTLKFVKPDPNAPVATPDSPEPAAPQSSAPDATAPAGDAPPPK
jgi:predicted methyltransferase